MTGELWDAVIVGQGLAGTTLAWHLHEAGQRVLLLDAAEPVTCSKIAAGLITPITGQRLTLSWRGDEFLPTARKFYARVEASTGTSFFHDRKAVRLFQCDDERQRWAKRGREAAFQAHLVDPQPSPLVPVDVADASGGGFAMRTAQLDVPAFLDAARSVLPYAETRLDWKNEVTLGPEEITVQGRRTRLLISCEGYAATRNPYFSWVPFKAAKGDILTIKFDGPVSDHCLHRGIWMAPTKEPNIFRVGSTYDWANLDHEPSAAGREEIERKLQECCRVPYRILNHQAAVRPIIQESKALLGLHPVHDRLGFFNGLGSKGSLHAPWFAQCFTEFLLTGKPLPEGLDLRKNF